MSIDKFCNEGSLKRSYNCCDDCWSRFCISESGTFIESVVVEVDIGNV